MLSENHGAFPENAPVEAIRREFAKRLQAALDDLGWTQSELARAAASHMGNRRFGRDNVSNYIRGKSLPGVPHLNALAKALHKKPSDLLPARYLSLAESKVPSLDVRDTGEGMAWLRVNRAVEWTKALEITRLLKED